MGGTAPGPMGGTDPGPGPGPAGLSCVGIFECFDTRMCQDQACAEGCFGEATPSGQQTFQVFQACAQSSGCPQDDQDCLIAACQNELIACQNDGAGAGPGPGPQGDLSCAEVFFCFNGCPEGNEGCFQNCFQSVRQSEAQALNGYITCLNDNMCQDQACVDTNCGAEQAACIPPGMNGCGEVLNCILGCRDDQCAFNCSISGDAQANMLLNDLGGCLDANACQDLNSCPACQTQLTACQGD